MERLRLGPFEHFRRPAGFAEQAFPYPAAEQAKLPVRLESFSEIVPQRSAQQVPGKKQAQQEHSLAARCPCLLQDLRPDQSWMSAAQFRNVAYPNQPSPQMLGPV